MPASELDQLVHRLQEAEHDLAITEAEHYRLTVRRNEVRVELEKRYARRAEALEELISTIQENARASI